MIGSTFSHYRLVRKIGEGGMGEVFLAEDLKLHRTVALKFLAARLTRDPDRKERFLQEARAAAAIEHPNVAVIHDVDEAEGRTFIAMEYVPGESLRDAIHRKSLTLGRAIELALQVADGLALAHARGVIHRDLKPENVLVSGQGYAKIIDFGLAKLLEPFGSDEAHRSESETLLRTREGVVMGTVAYMSPEQARGESVDARSDVFSLGVMLHEMISGESPFQRATAIETLNAILNEEPPAPRLPGGNLPTGLERVLLKAIVKSPARRYQSVTDLASDLREVRAELASAGRGGARGRQERGFRLWMAAGAIAVAVAIAVLFLVREPRSLAPGIGASGRPAIAALSFEDHSGDEALGWLSHGLPGMLLTGLAQTPGLDVISTRKIEEVLTGVDPESTAEASARLAEAARRAGAGAVVTGSIYKAGSELRLDVRVEDLETGRLLSAESVRGTDVFQLVDELTARVRESLRVEDRPAGRPIRDVTTDSLEAYRLYSEGVDARHNVRHADAWRLLEEAVAIDPSFAMAHFHLSAIASILGETALRDEHHRKAMENLARMPERQALLVQASDQALRGRMEDAISLLEKLLALYPDDEEGYDTYLHARDRMREPEKVLEITDRWARAIPGPGSGHFHNHRGYAFMQLDRYQEAIRAFEDYARVRPEEANPYDSLGELHLVMGQPDAALDYYTRALSLNPSFGFSLMGRVWASGMLGRYDDLFAELARLEALDDSGYPVTGIRFMRAFALSRVGRLREALDQIRADAGLAAQAGNTEAQVQFQLLSAWIQLESGDNADALEAVRKAGLSPPDSASPQAQRELLLIAHLLAGVAEARLGRVAEAQAHFSAMGTSPQGEPATETWYRKALEGEIAMAAGNLSAAERAFTAGDPERKMWFTLNRLPMTVFANGLPFRDGLARVAMARGDVAGAIAIYRKLLTPAIESKWTAVLEPRYVLELARLLGRAGEKEPARHEYQRFLDLWKDADTALPELRETREGAAAEKE